MSEHHQSFSALLTHRGHYRNVVIGGVVSQLGDWLSYIALSLIAFRDGSAAGSWGVGLSIAGVYLAHTLPNAVAAPLAGPLADRRERRSLMVWANIMCALITLALWSQAQSGSQLILQSLIFVRVMMSHVAFTARQAALPMLVTREELLTANALNSTVWSVLFTLGVALGGVLTSLFGPETALLIDATTFIITSIILARLPRLSPDDEAGCYAYGHEESNTLSKDRVIEDETQREEEQEIVEVDRTQCEDEETKEETVGKESRSLKSETTMRPRLGEAWTHLMNQSQLWVPLFAKTSIGIFNSSGWIALNIAAMSRFPEEGGLMVGLFTACRGLGMGFGPAVMSKKRAVNPIPAQWLAAMGVCLLIWSDITLLMCCGLFCWGVGNGINWVSSTAALQSLTPPKLLGRVTSLDFLLFTTCEAITILMTGWLFDRFGGLGASSGTVALLGIAAVAVLTCIDLRVRRDVT